MWEKVFDTGDEGHIDSNSSLVDANDRVPSTSYVPGREHLRFTHLIRRQPPHDESPLPNDNIFYGLCLCIGHLLRICTNRGLFVNEGIHQKGIRTCIDVVASLVFTIRAELGQRHTHSPGYFSTWCYIT